jgi:hypothetical protein
MAKSQIYFVRDVAAATGKTPRAIQKYHMHHFKSKRRASEAPNAAWIITSEADFQKGVAAIKQRDEERQKRIERGQDES